MLETGKDGKEESKYKLTLLTCRTVRIGSYRFVPKEEVVITSYGFKINTPKISDPTETCDIFVPKKYIIKVLVNFSKGLPVLFFYVMPSVGTVIRRKLGMNSDMELYFDPVSKEDPYKRITLLPVTISEESRNVIKDIFCNKPYKLMEELTPKEANDILIRTCPKEVTPSKPPLQNSSEIRPLLIYPPGKGGIAVNLEDYLCLAQDQFLNDVIIDFYLQYLISNKLTNEMKDKVHVFSSFFYKRLTTKPVKSNNPRRMANSFENDPALSAAQKRHCRVKKWTKNVNIFEKDFVIIPINENSHWFLAIICYPGLEGCRLMNDASKEANEPSKPKTKKLRKKDTSTTRTALVIGNTTITLETKKNLTLATQISSADKPLRLDDDEEPSDRDEAEGDESELDSDSDSDSTEETSAPAVTETPKKREPIRQPCILIFDSLAGGASRTRVVATLRDYLTCEHRAKHSSGKTFTKDNIRGACPKVPQQMNFTDCGLYVLQYVEEFFMNPITDYHIPIKLLKTWFEEIVVTRKREEISNLIKSLMIKLKKDVSILPEIQFPTLNGKVLPPVQRRNSGGSTDEEEDLEPGEIPQGEKRSLVSEAYNSDEGESSKTNKELSTVTTTSSSSPSPNSVVKTTPATTSSNSNRETMSYLKSKRITRHKQNESPNSNDAKKPKLG